MSNPSKGERISCEEPSLKIYEVEFKSPCIHFEGSPYGSAFIQIQAESEDDARKKFKQAATESGYPDAEMTGYINLHLDI